MTAMKRFGGAGLAVALGVAAVTAATIRSPAMQTSSSPPLVPATGQVPPMQIGINLGKMTYWSQEFAFTDLVKSSAIVIITPQGWKPAAGLIDLDEGGHPQNVPSGTRLVVILKSGGGGRLPAGTYNCVVSPGWIVKPSNAAQVSGGDERFTMTIGSSQSPSRLSLELTPRARSADLKALSCRSQAARSGQDFSPQFLADTQPFAVLRFMDWMKTNDQPPQEWSARTTPRNFSQTGPNGVAIEHMVALANTQNADPWFNMPLEAPDSYYRAFAIYVRDHLRADRRAYVEVSNEVWNGQFAQSKRATARGLELYPGETPKIANEFYHADRVRAVMTIWGEVFHGRESRIVRVLATQAGSVDRPTAALSHENTARFVDAVAVAPYFGPGYGNEPALGTDMTEYLLSHGSEFVDKAVKKGIRSRDIASKFGLPLITYEGGPDYVSYRPNRKAAYAAAEHDPRIYGIYTEFLQRWQREVGGLFVAFDFVADRFGHQLYTGQPLDDAPKMRALIDFINSDKRLKLRRAN